MKKITMTFYAAALSVAAFAQQGDSTNSLFKSGIRFQNPSLGQAKDSQSMYTPQYRPMQEQKTMSPIIQQKFQTQPSLQYPKQELQPGLRLQPLQTNPQIPSQTEPLDLNNSGNESVQPLRRESGTPQP